MNRIIRPYRQLAETSPLRYFDNASRGGFWGIDQSNSLPAVNILKKENGYQIEVSAPGMNKEDFSIAIEENQLVIKAEHKNQSEENKDQYIRKEFDFHKFSRSFTLDKSIDTASIQASYENGILNIHIAKKAEEPKVIQQIEIK